MMGPQCDQIKEFYMKVNGKDHSSIWYEAGSPGKVFIIDQRKLPFRFEMVELSSSDDAYRAIHEMWVRGAPLIGVTAAFGMYLAALEAGDTDAAAYMQQRAHHLKSARPTAVNLAYGVDRVMESVMAGESNWREQALEAAIKLRQDEVTRSKMIGQHGFKILKELYEKKGGKELNILTHCNAGWLACVDYGTATAPLYMAVDAGIPLHVWVDETRPRNQGARLTAWELEKHGISHTVIPDNTGGLLMQKGMVDAVIVGSDRTSANGDVVNKIGTYLKALAAYDNGIPFYVALPSSTIDMELKDAARQVIIEQRDEMEVRFMEGIADDEIRQVQVIPAESPVLNYGFDITPAKYVTALITEHGIIAADQESISRLMN